MTMVWTCRYGIRNAEKKQNRAGTAHTAAKFVTQEVRQEDH